MRPQCKCYCYYFCMITVNKIQKENECNTDYCDSLHCFGFILATRRPVKWAEFKGPPNTQSHDSWAPMSAKWDGGTKTQFENTTGFIFINQSLLTLLLCPVTQPQHRLLWLVSSVGVANVAFLLLVKDVLGFYDLK